MYEMKWNRLLNIVELICGTQQKAKQNNSDLNFDCLSLNGTYFSRRTHTADSGIFDTNEESWIDYLKPVDKLVCKKSKTIDLFYFIKYFYTRD